MGDVIQYLIDGTSGIVTGGVDGKCLVAGVCSRGTVGKAYLIGKRTDLGSMLGTGPLVDRVRDMLVTGGQEPCVVAVPVRGQPGGYISDLSITGGKTGATVSGYPALNADVVVRVKTGGEIGTATLEISTDGGKTFGEAAPSAAQNPVKMEETPTGQPWSLTRERPWRKVQAILSRCAARWGRCTAWATRKARLWK